jgi:hypothetical protein
VPRRSTFPAETTEVLRIFRNLLGAMPRRISADARDAADDDEHATVRFRPRLVAQLIEDHAVLRECMRHVLDACRTRNEDAQIIGLQRFAEAFRRVNLTKAVQFYPYLLWAIARDRLATNQFKAVHVDIQGRMQGIDALLREYLHAPWLSAQRRRLFHDVAKIAQLLAQACRMEEATLFPLYLPPGQYRHLRGVQGA